MIIPFGALALGALIRDEQVTALAVGGALLVVAGIARRAVADQAQVAPDRMR